MKRRSINKLLILFIFCSTYFITQTQGQTNDFKAGLLGGISSSQVSGDDLAGFHKAGFIVGGFTRRTITEKSSIQMELLYVQKGSRKTARPDEGDYFFYLLELDYIEIPLLYKIKKDKFVYEAGPSFGALILSRVRNQDGFYPDGHPQNRPFYRMETSINIGINYPLYNNFNINWRFSNSVLPIRKHLSGGTFQFNRGQYNTALEFTIRYEFKNDKK